MPINNSPYIIQIKDTFLVTNIDGIAQGEKFFEHNHKIPSILKWAGGKKWLSNAAFCLVPRNWNGKYFEPFLGSGALFFSITPQKAILSDLNEELINVFKVIKSRPRALINRLNSFPYDKNFYYQIRKEKPVSEIDNAARFIYLNKTCWNGLYRVNRNGDFNTPFGFFENPKICDSKNIIRASRALSKAELHSGGFESVEAEVKKGDFVYFDPPYITGHQNNGFLKYNKHLFSWDDQKRLAKLANKLAEFGANILVSNADHDSVVGLYKKFYYYRIFRNSLIGGKEAFRGKIFEAIFSSYPLIS